MVPHLPADLLVQALAATPKEDIKTTTAVLGRCLSVFSAEQNETLLSFLRDCLRASGRNHCLILIKLAAPKIAEIGGANAIPECVKAIKDVQRWWP